MTKMTLGLILVAAIAWLLVWLYGWLQMRGPIGKKVRVIERQEPVAVAQEQAESVVEDSDDLDPRLMVSPYYNRHRLDPLIDSLIALELERPILGKELLRAVPVHSRRIGSKTVMLEAYHPLEDQWEFPQPQNTYVRAQVGLQLGNRQGELKSVEFSEFAVLIEQYADSVGARIDIPDMQSELARAKELEELAQQVDVQVDLYVVAQGASWSVEFLEEHAKRLGFEGSGVGGQMTWRYRADSDAPVVHMLSLNYDSKAAYGDGLSQRTVDRVRLLLDVPHVPQELQAFEHMLRLAQQLAQELGGVVVDYAGNPMTQELENSIEAQLERVYGTLQDGDFPAGSALAQRLFS